MDQRLQLLATLLLENGLQYAFGVTGSGFSLSLITELEDEGVRYFPVAHETSAALMAGTVSRVSEKVSVSIGIKGPGVANMLPGIVSNSFEGNAALSICEAYGIDIPAYRMHKRLDHSALLSSVVKGIITLSDLEHGLTDLLQIAKQEVPGPVHLELCVMDHSNRLSANTMDQAEVDQNKDARREFFKHLRRSERPALIIGSLALRRKYSERLEVLDIPVFTTASAKGILDERLTHSAGVYTGVGKELAPEVELFTKSDLVVGFGLRNTEVIQPRSFDIPLIMFDEVNYGLAEGFKADVLLLSSPDLAREIFDELGKKSWGSENIQTLLARMRNYLISDDWLPATCFYALNNLDFLHALVLDTGSFCTVGEHLWQAAPNRYFIGSSNGRYMGTSIPSAIALAICSPELPVFCVVGDGGIGMYPAEIKLAVQEGLPICFILMTDGHYASIASLPQSKPMSSRATTLFRPSWFKSVEAMGCEAYLVGSEQSFTVTLEGWDRRKPLFIEAAFDPKLYTDMVNRLR